MRALSLAFLISPIFAANLPVITLVANAEGENPTIAPNTWVEVKGANLSNPGDSRTWLPSDFVNNQLPTSLDGVSVTVNGVSAYVYYISPGQINILTPENPMTGAVAVIVKTSAGVSQAYMAQAQALSQSFFVFNGGPYVAATHLNGSLLGPSSLYAGLTTPAAPGETVVLYANGFGVTSPAVVSGAISQSGSLATMPVVTVGGIAATVQFAGLISPGLFQFNVVIPAGVPSGDNALVATYGGAEAAPAAAITIQGQAAAPTSITFYVSPSGNDYWSGRLAAPNSNGTDGPFATFDRARAVVASISKTGLTEVDVQFRGGTYYLGSTEMMSAGDSGSATLQIVYENYPNETPEFSGGVRVTNWTNAGGNTWKATLPASTQYFENLFYNGARRLRPRLGGYLGTYLRIAASVYLNAAAPPAAAPNANCPNYVSGSGWECFDRFQYSPSDPIAGTWKNLAPSAGNGCGQPGGNAAIAGDIELIDFEQYNVSKLRISCVDATNHIVYLTGPTDLNVNHYGAEGFKPMRRYVIENVEDQLTQPGQWFLDRSSTPWTLTYLANTGENPNTDTAIAPQLVQLLVASNLQYVTFRGLTFEHDNFTAPAAGFSSAAEGRSSAVSFQNSQHIVFDSGTITETSGGGLEFISCLNAASPAWCVARSLTAVTANNTIENSAFYDIGTSAIRIGVNGTGADTNANVPQFIMVANNVVEGFGRVLPSTKGIQQGQGHDNTYTHNDVYDGYHAAIAVCYCSGGTVPNLTANNTISFNHVYNLFQGIENDGGSLYFGVDAESGTATGNKMLNNKVHDVNDASVMDSDGYGGDGLYIDDFTGLVDVENNLVYRVSGSAVSFSGPRAGPNQSSTIKNNIFAFARTSLINAYNPYSYSTAPPADMFGTVSNNIFYFDRTSSSSPVFYVQGGCTYAGDAFPEFEQWSSNLYWRSDGGFASDAKAFHVQPSLNTAAAPCFFSAPSKYTFYTLAGWQGTSEDAQSVVQNPGFNSPAYPADDFTLPKGSPGVGFVLFDVSQAGRSNPVIKPPAVAATFVTKTFNAATDF